MIAGALDAYSYLEHGEIFAGLQTGNFILLGIHLGRMEFSTVGHYLASILAFAVGTMLARGLQHLLEKRSVNQQYIVLWYELVLLVFVMIATNRLPDIVITTLLSLAAAAELQEFRRIKGAPFTPLMMTGNLRKASASLYDGVRYHDHKASSQALDTFTVLGSFAIGAILIGLFSKILAGFALIVPILIIVGLITWLYRTHHQRRWKH